MSRTTAMVFIDGQNLFHGSRSYSEENSVDDYEVGLPVLARRLTHDHDLIRSYYFDSFRPGKREDKQGFYKFLELNGFRVEANPLRERDGSYVEKGADISLATELIAHGFNDSYDVAAVVTGDDDFSRAIRYVQNQGKYVKVASFDSNFSSNLKQTADSAIVLDEVADKISRD